MGFALAKGVQEQGEYVIVKIHTDEGIVGIGETSPLLSISGDWQGSMVSLIESQLAPLIVGENVFNIEKIWEKMDWAVPRNSSAKGGIDIALYDAIGKKLDQPVYNLIGGLRQEKVPIVGHIGINEPDKAVGLAMKLVNQGYVNIRLKIGLNPKQDIAATKAVREAVGDKIQIRLDANQGYTAAVAIPTIKALERYEIVTVEQPVPWWDVYGLRRIARAVDVPINSDESIYTVQDALTLIRLEAVDIINVKMVRPGGLTGAMRVASMTEAAGIPCFVGTALEMGVATAAALHFAASNRNIRYPSEVGGYSLDVPWFEEDIIKRAITRADGYAEVPEGPGLGVELNEDVVEKYRVKK
jgi:muconate cycloisomerase